MSLTEVQFEGASLQEAPARAIAGRSPWQLAWRRLRSDRVAIASGIVILLLCAVALAAPLISGAVGKSYAQQFRGTGVTAYGLAVGLFAGFYGGVIDGVLARFMDTVLAFPYLLLGIALAAIFGPNLLMVIGVISFFSWAALPRNVRAHPPPLTKTESPA